MPAVYPKAMPLEEMLAVARESFSVSSRSEEGKEDAARCGRYAFSTTKDAPKPIFAKMARRLESGHIGDEEGRRKKQREEKDPSAANPKSKGLRYEAGFTVLRQGKHRIWVLKRTSIRNSTHGNYGQCLQCNGKGVCIEAT